MIFILIFHFPCPCFFLRISEKQMGCTVSRPRCPSRPVFVHYWLDFFCEYFFHFRIFSPFLNYYSIDKSMMIECFKVLFWLFEFSFVCDIKWKIRKKPIAATSLSQLWTKTIKEKKTNTFLPKLQGYSEKETVSCVLPLPDWIRCHQHHHQIPPIF